MTIALLTFLVAVLAQLLGACYNYQFLNVLNVPLSLHPLTLEDNIQTALSHLPYFVASTIAPPILGFAFRYHASSTPKLEIPESKNQASRFRLLTPLILPLGTLAAILLAFSFLPMRTAQYASAYIGLFFILNITFDKIQTFSLKNDIAFALFILLYLLLLVISNIQRGEIDGFKFKSETEIKYLIKVKGEQEEFISCSSLRIFTNDVVISDKGKISIIKKEKIQEINVF
jgi:hypothetical protein